MTVCCERNSIAPTLDLITKYPKQVWASFGCHPHEAKDWDAKWEEELRRAFAQNPKQAVAWGECGLDYFYKHSEVDTQKRVFTAQLQIAIELKKPVVVHSRDAEPDTIEIMTKTLPKEWRIHLHCFTGSKEMVHKLIDHFPNLCVGFTGCITFDSAAAQRETVKSIPLERLLLETDGPYMAPLPFRGAVCHPGHLPLTAQVMADVKGVTLQQLLAQVRKNVNRVYGI